MQNLQTQYEILRSMQNERLQKQLEEYAIRQSLPKKLSLRVRLFWYGGELLITFGKSLKHQVKTQYCHQLAIARHR